MVRAGAENSMADAALGGMPGCSWPSSTIQGEPSSSPPLSLIGDGSRRFCTTFQSDKADRSSERGTERSAGGWAKPDGCTALPAAPLQLFPRTWAAKEQCIGVGILLVMPPGCTGSGWLCPGLSWEESCTWSSVSMSISMSTSCVRYPSTISGAWLKAAPLDAWGITTAGAVDDQLLEDGFCCTLASFASSESESPGVRVRGGCCAVNELDAV